MTDDTDENTNADDDTTPFSGHDRQQVLAQLNDALNEAHRKVTSGRVYDPEKEKVRQGWIRVLGYTAKQYRSLKKDKEYEELAERLEALEAAEENSRSDYRMK